MDPPGPSRRTASRHLPSLRGLPSGRFPRFLGTMKVLRPLPSVPLARFPSPCGTTPAPAVSAPFGPQVQRPRAWGLFNRPPPVTLSVETTVPPRFLGDPRVRTPCSSTPPEPRRFIRLRSVSVLSLHLQLRGPRDWSFRGSIARLAHFLSTLRGSDRSESTQDSVPAVASFAGWDWLPTGSR